MGQQLSRSALYDLVWSEPRTALAKRFGLSDVGLAKACVRANVPMPPRGYWARLAAGKRIPQVPLPARGLGQSDMVRVGAPDYRSLTSQDEATLPPAPTFEDTLETLRLRAGTMVARAKVPKSLHRPHHLIAKLLEEDTARRAALERDRYAWPKPMFDTPDALRRARLYNGLCMVMAHAGCSIRITSQDLQSVAFGVGDTSVPTTLHSSGKNGGRPDAQGSHGGSAARFTLTAEVWPPVPDFPHEWQDEPALALEDRIVDVARDLLVLAEMAYRNGVLQQHAWRVERNNELERKAAEARACQEREERERQQRLEQERRDWLLQQAANLQHADAIRLLVRTLDGRNDGVPADVDAYRQWRQWALCEADRLDPRLLPVSALAGPAFNRPADPDAPEPD